MAEEEEDSNFFDTVDKGDKELVKVLLHDKNQKLNPNFKNKFNGMTALHKAAQKGFEEIVKILLEHGFNVDLQTNDGETALHWAAFKGFKEIVNILLERGANVDLRTSTGKTALHWAAFKGFEEIVKILLNYGSSIHFQDKDGFTVLDIANEKIVDLINKHQEWGKNIKPAQKK